MMTILSACSNEGLGRRRPGDINGGDIPVSKLIENPNWTVTYNGRGVSTYDYGTVVEDIISVSSSDSKKYYVDLVSWNALSSDYGNSLDRFVESSLSKLVAGNSYQTSLSSGNDVIRFIRLDNGGGQWIAVAYGVDSNGKLTNEYASVSFNTVEVQMQKSDNWEISYKGRDTKTDKDSIVVTSSSASTYYVDAVYKGYVKDSFDGDVYKFFNAMLDKLSKQLGEKENDFTRLIYKGKTTLLFDRLRAGDWTAYVYGVDKYGYVTGSYSTLDFSIAEEVPTAEYSRWLGKWEISPDKPVYDQNGSVVGNYDVSYSLEISKSEANVAYIVSGWETKDKNIVQFTSNMKFEALFDRATGSLIFTSYDLGSWQGNDNNYYTTILSGLYLQNNKELIFLNPADFAKATMSADNRTAKANGLQYTDSQGSITFCGMCYIDIKLDSDNNFAKDSEGRYSIGIYSKHIPYFPMTMSYTGALSATASVELPVSSRKPAVRISARSEQSVVKSVAGRVAAPRAADGKSAVRRHSTYIPQSRRAASGR